MKCFSIVTPLLLAAVMCVPALAQEGESMFDAPVVLKVGDKPLNADGEIMYPSPAIFDIDNDGKDELVIGSIFGSVHACENESDSSGEPVWSEPKVVKTNKNEPLELNNW